MSALPSQHDQEIEKHAKRRQVLLHRRLAFAFAEVFDVRGDQEGGEIEEPDLLFLAPPRKLRRGTGVRLAGVRIANPCRKELNELRPSFGASVKEERWDAGNAGKQDLAFRRDE